MTTFTPRKMRSILINLCIPICRHEFECCVDAGEGIDDDMLFVKIDGKKLLNNLLHGINVGVVGIGMEGEKPGAFSSILSTILRYSREMLAREQEKGVKVDISFGIFGVSDTSCIDLVNYTRKELSEMEELAEEWSHLGTSGSIDEVISSLEKGYSLPCVLLVRIFVKRNHEPGAMSTLLLADLGTMGGGGPLDRSFARFSSIVTDESLSNGDSKVNCHLTFFLDEYFGGNAVTLVIADIPKSGGSRSLSSHISFLSGLRCIKNRPIANLETPEMMELAELMETHGRLEAEHRSVSRELKHLQKALKRAELEHIQLVEERANSVVSDEVRHWEYEYELAKLTMEKVAVHEKIRQCEIDLVCMEHDRLILLTEMELKRKEFVELEERLTLSQNERRQVEDDFNKEITGLTVSLDAANSSLKSAEVEKLQLKDELKAASEKITDLEGRIKQVQEKMDIRHTEHLKEQTAELKKLRSELNLAKQSEETLGKKLSIIENESDAHKGLVKEFEKKLNELKMENTSLLAKIEVLSREPQSPEIKRTLKEMEEKWQAEREAMRMVMDDLRKVIIDKDRQVLDQTNSTIFHPMREKNSPVKKRKMPKKGPHLPASTSNLDDNELDLKEAGKKKREKEQIPLKRITRSSNSSFRASDVKNKFAPPVNEKATKGTKKQVKRVIKEDGKTFSDVLPIAKPAGALIKDSTSKDNTLKPAVPGAVKLQPKKQAKAPTVAETSRPITKILEPEEQKTMKKLDEDVEIPGTPQKKAVSSAISAASPAKVWKPSAFIPSVIPRKNGFSKENQQPSAATAGLFANFTFAPRSGDEAGLKRVKLPDRQNKPHAENNTDTNNWAEKRKNNVDPTVFSTIMGSFDLPTNIGRK